MISVGDELWGFTSEASRRLWDELVPPPTRKAAWRLVVTYAGFIGESLLLEDLYRHGTAADRARSVCRCRHADVLDASAGGAMADTGMAGADAPIAAADTVSANDRKSLDQFRVRFHRNDSLGPLC